MNAVPESTVKKRILVLDDDELVGASVARLLEREGYAVDVFTSPFDALASLSAHQTDAVVSDIVMPGMNGIELLRRVRASDDDVPVVLLTGTPRIEDAMKAMEYGAFRFLTKPVVREELTAAVSEALKWRHLSRAAADGPLASTRAALEASFLRALQTIRMVYQPIASPVGEVFGYEALMRSSEPSLPSPPAVLEAAEKLGSVHVLGRHLRRIVAAQADLAPGRQVFFVNLHSADLADPDLYDATGPLGRHASSIVLELTERASLEGIGDVERRLGQLREMGYRIAVDDLGAGYAGLSYFARVRPEIVKIDMSLTRDVDRDPVRRKVVGSLCELARTLDMAVVAEGIETKEELEVVVGLGAQLLQGYALARPGPPFPTVKMP